MYSTAVVGAGMLGSSAAKWAAGLSPQEGVVLLGEGEEGEYYGAWSDEGRIASIFESRPNWRILARESIKRYRQIEEESRVELFQEVGYLELIDQSYEDTEEFIRTAEVLQAEGFSCKKVAGEEGAALFPYLDFQPGVWGYYQPDWSGYINPRALVHAQQVLAERRRCELVRDGVMAIHRSEEGLFNLHLVSGRTITAGRVILATGAYLNLSNHLNPFLESEVALRLRTQTVSYLRVSRDEAARLQKMPNIVTTYPSGLLDGTYILPPILYPDGHYYLKLGHHNHFEREVNTLEELNAWYRDGEGEPKAVTELVAFIRGFLPGLKVEDVSAGWCVTSNTPTKDAPYIDEVVPGLVVAAGGCGIGAMSCDEIGRLAAVLSVEGRWDSAILRDSCSLVYSSSSKASV